MLNMYSSTKPASWFIHCSRKFNFRPALQQHEWARLELSSVIRLATVIKSASASCQTIKCSPMQPMRNYKSMAMAASRRNHSIRFMRGAFENYWIISEIYTPAMRHFSHWFPDLEYVATRHNLFLRFIRVKNSELGDKSARKLPSSVYNWKQWLNSILLPTRKSIAKRIYIKWYIISSDLLS